jgi:hypothetical protein
VGRNIFHPPTSIEQKKCEEQRRRERQIFQHSGFVLISKCGKNNEHCHNHKMWI